MTKDGYAVAGYLLVAMTAIVAAMVLSLFGLSFATALMGTLAAVAIWIMVIHMMAMVIFGGPVLHDFGAARRWWPR